MKVLMVGSGSGSWQMRGVQLGAAMGARVVSDPSDQDIRWADVVVLVKRAGTRHAQRVRAVGRPLVWDALDCWHQPAMHRYTETQALTWLKSQIDFIRPDVTIGATEAMARAVSGVYLPHHGWAGLRPTPARETVKMVAYEGNPMYLGKWAGAIRAACEKRGWQFVLNPPDLSQADILVAFRDGQWDGWMCRQWKSGVKLVNAICAGRPILTQPCAAADELKPSGMVLDDVSEVGAALDVCGVLDVRERAVELSRNDAVRFDVQAIAVRYQAILAEQVPACAR